MALPPYKNPAQWRADMAFLVAEGDRLQIDIYSAVYAMSLGVNNNITRGSLASTSVAMVGNTAPLAALFTGKNIVGIVGEDAAGNPVAISALIDNPGFSGSGTFDEKMAIMAAANNGNLTGTGGLSLTALIATDIVINFVAGHGLVNIHVYTIDPTLT